MTDRLEVDLPSLLTAAAVVDALAERTADLPAGRALRRAADTVPGGLLAESAAGAATSWARQAEQLREALDAAAGGLRGAARTYRRTDEAAAADVPAIRSCR